MSTTFWIGLAFGLVALLLLVIWSIRRHRSPSLRVRCDMPIAELMPSLSGLTLGSAIAGNSVEVLENGAYFDVLEARIRAARHSVHFETFLWKPGKLSDRISAALIDQARAGRQVRVLLDAQGSKTIEK
ncbi:MAG: hypothetical protein EOO24_23575, partial [Comamonadaceae bacterium]